MTAPNKSAQTRGTCKSPQRQCRSAGRCVAVVGDCLRGADEAAMREDDDGRGLLWRLPKLRAHGWGAQGPAFGYGIGCGVGLGAGVVGGAGIGLGFPGLQVGFGVGAGCGVGVGFGYGLGKGRAYDENGTYCNVGRLPKRSGGSIAGSSGAEIGAMIDDFVSGVKRALDNIENGNGKRRR